MVNLTEQYRKGELPAGRYWIKYRSGRIDEWDLLGGKAIETKPKIVEVLAEVPSYDEWERVCIDNTGLRQIRDELDCAVTELREKVCDHEELLKECLRILRIQRDFASCEVEQLKCEDIVDRIIQTLGENNAKIRRPAKSKQS